MTLERRYRFNPGFLYLTPVLDVAFVLGLFSLLSTSFLLQPGIAVEVPKSPFVLAPQRNPVVVSIAGSPAEAIYFENQVITLEALGKLWDQGKPSGTIVIKADSSASHATVVAIANLALERGIPAVLATSEEP